MGNRLLWIVGAVAVAVGAVVGVRAFLRRRARTGGAAVAPPDLRAAPPIPDDTPTPSFGIPVVAPAVRVRADLDAEATDPGLRVPVPSKSGTSGFGPAKSGPSGFGTSGFGPAGPGSFGPGGVLLAAADPRLRRSVPPPAGAWPGPRPPGPAYAMYGAYPPVPAWPGTRPVAVATPRHRWGLGAYLLAEAVFLGVSALIGLTLIGGGPVSAGVLAVALGVPSVVAALAAVVITIVRGNGPFVDLRLHWSWRQVWIGLAFGFGGLFISLPASAIYVTIVGEDASSAVGDVFGGATASPVVALGIAALVVLVVPLCEEILYRGLLWGGLTRLGANAWVAFGVTTVIFALAHFEWPRAILLLVVALPIGLARIYGDGLLSPIIAHQANNLLPGIGLYLMLTGAFPAI